MPSTKQTLTRMAPDLSTLSRSELEALAYQLLQEKNQATPNDSNVNGLDMPQRMQELTILHAVADACAEETNETQLIGRVTDILCKALDLDIFGVLFLNDKGLLSPHPAYKTLDKKTVIMDTSLGQGVVGLVAADGQPRNVPDVTKHPHYISVDPRIRSELCVPFKLYGRIVGVLNAESTRLNAFTTADERLLQIIAERLGNTIERLRGAARNELHAHQLAMLNHMAQTLTSSLNLAEVLQRIIDSVFDLVKAEGVVVLLQEQAGSLTFAAVSGQGAAGLQGKQMPDSEGIAGQVLKTGKPIHIRGREHSPAQIYAQAEQVSGFNTETLLAVPIILNGQTIGVIEAAHSHTNAFDNSALTLLISASHWAAITIRNAQLFKQEHDARVLSETLRKANLALTQTLDLKIVLNNFLQFLYLLIPYDGACILLVKNNQELEIKAVEGYENWSEMQQSVSSSLPIDQYALFQKLLTERKSILVNDTKLEPHWVVSHGLGTGYNWLGVPLVANDKVIGIYSLDKKATNFFTPEHVERAETLAAQAAVALENALLYETQRQQFKKLQHSQAQLIQAEKMGALGRLAASIGHEINNPIQAIQGCLTLVTEELAGNQDQKSIDLYMEILNDELSRIANIVRRLREFYRPVQQSMEHVDLALLFDTLIELSHKQFERSFIYITRHYPDNLPLIYANPDHLKQVFLNLLLNSLDAMPHGGQINIKIRVENPPQTAPPLLKIELSDTGEGIPPDILEQLFEPFTTTKPHGSGLGLSISYGIIQEHGGQITVQSELGQGTTFIITLPLI